MLIESLAVRVEPNASRPSKTEQTFDATGRLKASNHYKAYDRIPDLTESLFPETMITLYSTFFSAREVELLAREGSALDERRLGGSK